MLNNMACHLRYALLVVAVVIVIILLSRWTGKKSGGLATPTLTPLARVHGDVKSVVEEAAAANEAAHAQPNRLEALIDVTSALATLNTASTLAGKEPVTQAAGVPVRTLEQELAAHQRQLLTELHGGGRNATPTLQPLPKI